MRMKDVLTRRRALVALLAAAMVAAALGAAGTGRSAEREPVKFGVTLALTGAGAATDRSYQAGIQAAVAYINAKGGVLGGRKLEAVTRDTATSPTQAASAMRELAGDDSLAFFFLDPISSLALAQAPVATQAARPAIALAAADLLDADKNPWIFYFGESTGQTAEVGLRYLAVTRKLKRIGVLYENNPFGAGMIDPSKSVAAKYGATIVGVEGFQPGTTSVSAQLQKLRSAGAQALVLWTYGPGLAVTMRGRQDLNWHPPSITTPGVAVPVIADAVGGAKNLKNVYGYLPGKPMLVSKPGNHPAHAGQVYLRALPRSYHSDLIQPSSSFDAIRTLAAAIDRAKSTDPEAIRRALESAPYVGVRSTYRFSASNRRGVQIATVGIFRADTVCTKKNGCVAAPGLLPAPKATPKKKK